MDTVGCFPGGKAAGVWKNGGPIPPLPHTSLKQHNYNHLEGLSLLACSVLKNKVIILLAFLY
jgi:hypothetical protein